MVQAVPCEKRFCSAPGSGATPTRGPVEPVVGARTRNRMQGEAMRTISSSTGNPWTYQWCKPCYPKNVRCLRPGACNPNPWTRGTRGWRPFGMNTRSRFNQWRHHRCGPRRAKDVLACHLFAASTGVSAALDNIARRIAAPLTPLPRSYTTAPAQSHPGLSRSIRAVFGPFASAVLARYG